MCWDLEDKRELEKCNKSEIIELHKTKVGQQVEGICKGTILASKGKTEAEVEQYLSQEIYKCLSDFFSKKAVTVTTIRTTTTTTMTITTTKRVKVLLVTI